MATITFQGRPNIATIAIIAIFLVFVIAIIKQKQTCFQNSIIREWDCLVLYKKLWNIWRWGWCWTDQPIHRAIHSAKPRSLFFFNRSLSFFYSAGMSGVIGYFPGRYHYALAATVSLVCSAVHQDKLVNLIEKVPTIPKDTHTFIPNWVIWWFEGDGRLVIIDDISW